MFNENLQVFGRVVIFPDQGVIFPELEDLLQNIERMYAVIVVARNASTVDLRA